MGSFLSRILQGWYQHQGGQEISDHNYFVTQVTHAVEEGDVEALRELQEENKHSLFGGIEYVQWSPPLLMTAASHGHANIVKYLMDLGLDVDATNTCGMTALHEAGKKGHCDCLEQMLPKTRDLDCRDIWGRTPLIKALVYGKTNVAKLLLERGANPNAVDTYGMTPLTTAVDYHQFEMIRLLVHHGADLNLICWYQPHQCSGPPLYRAINNQCPDVVVELLRLGSSTQPRQRTTTVSRDWDNMSFSMGFEPIRHLPWASRTTSTHHDNAVNMAMCKLVEHNRNTYGGSDAEVLSAEVLMAVLAAHGLQLGTSIPEVMARVLTNRRSQETQQVELQQQNSSAVRSEDVINMLLLKLHLCSSSCQEPSSLASLSDGEEESQDTAPHLGRLIEDDGAANGAQVVDGGEERSLVRRQGSVRTVVSLHTQARRVARKAMMSSGRNVMWAIDTLACPPALKTLLLLKDVDRAFSASTLKSI